MARAAFAPVRIPQVNSPVSLLSLDSMIDDLSFSLGKRHQMTVSSLGKKPIGPSRSLLETQFHFSNHEVNIRAVNEKFVTKTHLS
jgi:hypothetical protein